MSAKAFIARKDLPAMLEKLAGKIDVWVPVASGDNLAGVEFRPLEPGAVPILDRRSSTSPKKVLFPQVERLMAWSFDPEPDNPAKRKLHLSDVLEVRPTLIFGARPCDVTGFFTFDPVFGEGKFEDVYYRKRRDAAVFATLVCREADNACFCSSVGGGPANMAGSDMSVTPVGEGYVLEALTEKGEQWVPEMGAPPTPDQEAEALKVLEETQALQIGNLDLAGIPQLFMDHFQDMDYWCEKVGQCLSCGVCTFVCPTCYCFTITDEPGGTGGERIRSWDSCMFHQYTQEASGHNPRPTKLERYRNRAGHKFSYIPEKYEGKIGCCGCGRCIRHCPVSIDIRAVVAGLKEKADECPCV